jgi:hypothetical protein
MIFNQNGEAFTNEPFFNSQFIKNNQILTITGDYSFKKNKDLIRKVPGSFTYGFNRSGQLISSINLRWNGKTIDTTVQYYTYNELGSVVGVKKTENNGVTLNDFERDSLNRITAQINYRVSINNKGEVLKKN